MWVVIKKAFFEGELKVPGDEIELPDDFSGKWAVKKSDFKPEPEEDDAVKIEKAVEALQGKKTKKKAKKKKVLKKKD